MIYADYSYLWPPRPENAIPQGMIPMFEKRRWWAQVKKNGTCTLVFTNGADVHFRTRHGDELHKAWEPLPAHVDFFRRAPGDGWQVYTAELLHSKTPSVKHQLYLFDQIVRDGVQLIGETFAERQRLLHDRFAPKGRSDSTTHPCGAGSYRVGQHVSLAVSFGNDFGSLWQMLGQEDEGLVLKNPDAKLAPCITPSANAFWQVKSRKPTKNYSC